MIATAFWEYLSNNKVWDGGDGETGGGENGLEAAVGMKGKRLHIVYVIAKENGTISRNISDEDLTSRSWD